MNEQQQKEFEACLEGENWIRMVAQVDWKVVGVKDSEDPESLDAWMLLQHVEIFPYDELEEYNAVLSVCSDGMHRPCWDLDHNPITILGDSLAKHITSKAGTLTIPGDSAIVPSTHNWHVYERRAMTWKNFSEYLTRLREDQFVQRGYAEASQHRGFALLRAPWEHKQ